MVYTDGATDDRKRGEMNAVRARHDPAQIPNLLFIHGEWRPAADGARMPVIDPATEQEIDRIPVAAASDLDDALQSSQRGFETWRDVDPWSRSDILRRCAHLIRERTELLAAVLTDEQGKPLDQARGEAGAAADQFDWYADEARRIYGQLIDGRQRDKRMIIRREPIGPVAAFTPWNFPSLLPARKLAPALAAGCSVVLKPAEEAPRSAFLLAGICREAGVPAGAVNVVTGDPEMISRHLISSPIIRKATLTGSVRVGRLLMALCASHPKPISLELGGHSPVLVFDDAEAEPVARQAAAGKFRNAGQVCVAASRFFVHESLADSFTEHFTEATKRLRVGDGRAPGVDVGPLSNLRRVEATAALVEDAVERGARLHWGGVRPAEHSRGFFFAPTVLSGVDEDMAVMNEEPFGPIAPITSFANLEEAAARANDNPYGLAAYVFTRDLSTAWLAAEALEAGMVGVNNLVVATAEAPFGGVKMSGFGREGGAEGLDAYTVSKHINMALPPP